MTRKTRGYEARVCDCHCHCVPVVCYCHRQLQEIQTTWKPFAALYCWYQRHSEMSFHKEMWTIIVALCEIYFDHFVKFGLYTVQCMLKDSCVQFARKRAQKWKKYWTNIFYNFAIWTNTFYNCAGGGRDGWLGDHLATRTLILSTGLPLILLRQIQFRLILTLFTHQVYFAAPILFIRPFYTLGEFSFWEPWTFSWAMSIHGRSGGPQVSDFYIFGFFDFFIFLDFVLIFVFLWMLFFFNL